MDQPQSHTELMSFRISFRMAWAAKYPEWRIRAGASITFKYTRTGTRLCLLVRDHSRLCWRTDANWRSFLRHWMGQSKEREISFSQNYRLLVGTNLGTELISDCSNRARTFPGCFL